MGINNDPIIEALANPEGIIVEIAIKIGTEQADFKLHLSVDMERWIFQDQFYYGQYCEKFKRYMDFQTAILEAIDLKRKLDAIYPHRTNYVRLWVYR